MEIKTSKEIIAWTRSKSLSELNIKPYNKKWVMIDEIVLLLETQRKELDGDFSWGQYLKIIDRDINTLQEKGDST